MRRHHHLRAFERSRNADDAPRVDGWPVARFPSRRLREEFMDEVKLWNRSEGLPTILTEKLGDGMSLRYWSDDGRRSIIERLIETYGGYAPRPPAASRALSGRA
jgi:hypothetical protein